MTNREFKPPSYTDLRTAVFRNHPFHCAHCNKELQFKNIEFRCAIRQYTEIMLSTHHDEAVCNRCFAERIKKWFKIPQDKLEHRYFYPNARVKGDCDACGKRKITAHIIWEKSTNCRFGIRSWNSAQICKDCLVKTVLHGRIVHRSGSVKKDGQEFVRNEIGALIPVDSTW